MRITAAAILLAFAGAMPATASDIGPVAAVAAIRHDFPLLLAASFENERTKPTVDWVVTDGHNAIATWQAAELRGMVNLRLRSGRWWWRAAAIKTRYNSEAPWTRMRVPGVDLGACDSATFPDPPSANSLLADGFIDKAMAHELSSRLPSIHTSDIAVVSTCSRDPRYLISTTGGSEATFIHKEEYRPSWFDWVGRTEADRGGETDEAPDALYSFDLTARRANGESGMQKLVQSTLKPLFDVLLPTPPPTLTFGRNSTIDVWFPYVLAQDHCVLSISGVTPEIAGIVGTFRNNVLHFVLPAFTLDWGEVAHGRVDGASVEPSDKPTPPHRADVPTVAHSGTAAADRRAWRNADSLRREWAYPLLTLMEKKGQVIGNIGWVDGSSIVARFADGGPNDILPGWVDDGSRIGVMDGAQ